MQLAISDLVKHDYVKSLLGKTELKSIKRTGRAHDIKRVKQQLAKGYSIVEVTGRGKDAIITLDKPKLIGRNGDTLRAEFINAKAAKVVKVVLLNGNSRSMTNWLTELGLNRTQDARQQVNKLKFPGWNEDRNSLTKGDALVILSDIERFNLGLAKAALKVVADTYQVKVTNVVYGIWQRDIKLSMTREERQAKVRRLSRKTVTKLDAARDSIIATNKDINIFNVYNSRLWADAIQEIGLWKCWKETELTGLTADKIKGHKVDLTQDSTKLSWLELYQQHLSDLENKYSSWADSWGQDLKSLLESGLVTKEDLATELGRSLKDRKAYRAYTGQLSLMFSELQDLLKSHDITL